MNVELYAFYIWFSVLTAVYGQYYLDNDNRFINLLIVINEDVQEGDRSLLENIKQQFEAASKSLWKATSSMHPNKAGVQFGTIYISIPTSWSTAAESITWQQCNKADFYVISKPFNEISNEPFTKQLGKCGEPGEFTKFSQTFFSKKVNFELLRAGKIIMNEFVKLRYGVFSEKPYNNRLTVFDGLRFINSTCGAHIQWTINKDAARCSDRNTDCRYILSPNQTHKHSVMFDPDSPQTEYFCDDSGTRPHNRWAQSLHNRKCKGQSITTVILKHKDFAQNKPNQNLRNVEFKIVKNQKRKIVLVIDISGSMNPIIANMRNAAEEFLRLYVEDTAEVGLVVFSTEGSIKSNLLNMGNTYNRNHLLGLVRGLQAAGGTNIPHGIAKGVEVLGGSITNYNKVYGTMILLSDGGNNVERPYTYESVIGIMLQKGIIVNTLCYGNAADVQLTRLADGTKGKFVYADPQKPYPELLKQFAVRQACEIKINETVKQIDGETELNIRGQISESDLTYIDSHVGVNVAFTLTLPTAAANYEIVLVDPNGNEIKAQKVTAQSSGITSTFFIPGKPVVGFYKVRARRKSYFRYKRSPEGFKVSFTVAAQPKANTRIINPTGELSNNKIEVVQEMTSVKAYVDLSTCSITEDENVTVNLTITKPDNSRIIISMDDNGIGDDSTENDKVFTASILAKHLNLAGFYTLSADVQIKSSNETIRRTVDLGSVRVITVPVKPIPDKIPPARIEDVTISIADSKSKIVDVHFPASGNDGMVGNISSYNISVSSSNNTLYIPCQQTTKPTYTVKCRIRLENDKVTNPFFISVKGIDQNQNEGEWSLSRAANWKYEEIIEKILTEFNKDESRKLSFQITVLMICISAALFFFN